MKTVKELKALSVGEKVDSIELFFETASEMKKSTTGNMYQTVTFKDASGDKIRTSPIFGITADKDWRKVQPGTSVLINNFIIGEYAPAGQTPNKQIDAAKYVIAKTTVASVQNELPGVGKDTTRSKKIVEGKPMLVSEREKHEYYANKDEIMMREVALKTATDFWTSPNLVSVFGADKLKQGLLDPLVVLTTAMFYYAWLGNECHPEVNERLADLLTLEELTGKSGMPSLPVDELIVRFIQPAEILKSVRETMLALAQTKQKEFKKETKDVKKDTPTE